MIKNEKGLAINNPSTTIKRGNVKKKTSFYDSFLFRYIGLISVLTVLIFWELLYQFNVINPIFLSSPLQILKVGYQLAVSGVLLENLAFTLKNFFVGFILAAVAGISIGLITGWYKPLGKAFDPFLTAMLGTPRIVLLPLITLWVGVGFSSKVLLVFLAGVFPIILNTMSGVQNLDPNPLE